jgi:Skp family chaperone for outer membrane proteins
MKNSRQPSEEADESVLPKKTLGKKAPLRQSPPPREPSKRRQRTEVTYKETRNPEEEDLEE